MRLTGVLGEGNTGWNDVGLEPSCINANDPATRSGTGLARLKSTRSVWG